MSRASAPWAGAGRICTQQVNLCLGCVEHAGCHRKRSGGDRWGEPADELQMRSLHAAPACGPRMRPPCMRPLHALPAGAPRPACTPLDVPPPCTRAAPAYLTARAAPRAPAPGARGSTPCCSCRAGGGWWVGSRGWAHVGTGAAGVLMGWRWLERGRRWAPRPLRIPLPLAARGSRASHKRTPWPHTPALPPPPPGRSQRRHALAVADEAGLVPVPLHAGAGQRQRLLEHTQRAVPPARGCFCAGARVCMCTGREELGAGRRRGLGDECAGVPHRLATSDT